MWESEEAEKFHRELIINDNLILFERKSKGKKIEFNYVDVRTFRGKVEKKVFDLKFRSLELEQQ